MTSPDAADIEFGPDGLVPVVAQDAATGDVLMLAFMNAEALHLTRTTGEAHYWSRSRKALWRKGATSGHVQRVAEIRVNCEHNSLLLLVRQTGAVCHAGYPTCYYRRLDDDGGLTVVRARSFDPAIVYGADTPGVGSEKPSDIDHLGESTRRQFGAYAYLRDNDLTAQSTTSRRLRASNGDFADRVAGELHELAGVLDGQHRHTDFLSDLRLEASQVVYWLLMECLCAGVTWSSLRPDRALSIRDVDPNPVAVARLLRAEANRWTHEAHQGDVGARAHAALALVALACRSGGLDPLAAVEADLEELQARPYLAPYFGHEDECGDLQAGRP